MSSLAPKPAKKSKTFFIIFVLAFFGLVGLVFSQEMPTTKMSSKNLQKQNIVIAYQTNIDPIKVAQAEKQFEQNTNYNIVWKKFDSGADVLAAMASGDVDIGNIGSSPFATASSKNLPLQVFFISGVIGDSEALVTRKNIQKPEDLIGKKIAVPFVSTTHYSFLSALKHWNIDKNQLHIVNLRPPEIMAAWQRGDIDGAYVWEPALGKLKQDGHVLVSSKTVGQWGAATYDVWVVRKDFSAKHTDFLTHFVKIANQQVQQYKQNPTAYIHQADKLQKIASLTGSNVADIPQFLAGNDYPDLNQQITILKGSFPQDIKNTAIFLHTQGKVERVQNDYTPFVNTQFIQAALEQK